MSGHGHKSDNVSAQEDCGERSQEGAHARFQIEFAIGFASSAKLGGMTGTPRTREAGHGAKPRGEVCHSQGARSIASSTSSRVIASIIVTRPPRLRW
jgi:hypothetical protein